MVQCTDELVRRVVVVFVLLEVDDGDVLRAFSQHDELVDVRLRAAQKLLHPESRVLEREEQSDGDALSSLNKTS